MKRGDVFVYVDAALNVVAATTASAAVDNDDWRRLRSFPLNDSSRVSERMSKLKMTLFGLERFIESNSVKSSSITRAGDKSRLKKSKADFAALERWEETSAMKPFVEVDQDPMPLTNFRASKLQKFLLSCLFLAEDSQVNRVLD